MEYSRSRRWPLVLLYTTIVVLGFSMVFTRVVREPYPSVNMPSFSRSGIVDGVVPSTYFEITYFENNEEVWVGDLRELFDDVPPVLYQYNMRFIFFNDEGKTSVEGDNMRMKLVSLVPGGKDLYFLVKEWAKNEIEGDPEKDIPDLICRRKPDPSIKATSFQINEYTEYYDLEKGFLNKELVRSKTLNFFKPCNP
jgi:hypothetical protein